MMNKGSAKPPRLTIRIKLITLIIRITPSSPLDEIAKMKNGPEQRYRRGAIDFAIRFSGLEPAALAASDQPGDLPNLIYSLYRFGFLWPLHNQKTEADRLVETIRMKPSLLDPAVQVAREILAAAAGGGKFEWKVESGTKILFDGASKAESAPRTTIFMHGGPHKLEQAVVFGLTRVLDSAEGEMVRECSREGCSRVFLAARPKQIYCSRRCASAAVFERFKKQTVQRIGEEAYKQKRAETVRKSALRLKRLAELKSGTIVAGRRKG
jgi:hypothetical protein